MQTLKKGRLTDRVLEIGGFAAGYCGRLFVRGGAQVMRVDDIPGMAAHASWADAQATALYLHSGKERVAIVALDQLADLAAQADVVVCEVSTADELLRLGFDDWPTPIKVALTPFGRTGPKRNWQATPNVIMAMGGYTQLMGDPDRAPLNLPGFYLEFQTGTLAYAAANACRGAGQTNVIDLGMLETLMTLSQFTTVRWHCAGELRSRHGSDFWFVVPSNLFACADGWVYLNIVPTFWDPLTVFLDRPELLVDERFLNNDLRMAHRDELHLICAEVLAPLKKAEVIERAETCRIPLGVVQSFDEVLADPHLSARGFFEELRVGADIDVPLRSPGLPYRLKVSGQPDPPAIRVRPAEQRRVPESPAISGPLNGVRVLDLTHVWAGPLAVRILSDLGAEVTKIEAPYGRGPRQLPAAPIGGWLGGEPGADPWNNSALFVKLHRNRRSVCVDLKQEAGRNLLLELVAQADVLIENFSAAAMDAMGLGYEVLKASNPQVVYVTMPGYGASGPYSNRVAFGPVVEPLSGLTHMLGYGPHEPRNSAMALMDPVLGLHAVAAVVQALRERDAMNSGCCVEMSLHEGGVSYSGPWLLERQMGGDPKSIGNRHPRMAPHGVYRCRGEDEWLALACSDDEQWKALLALLTAGRSGRGRDNATRLDADWSMHERLDRADLIDAAISMWTRERGKQQACEQLQRSGVAAGPVNTTPEMVADPQVVARRFFVPYERFDTPMPGNPLHMQGLDSAQWQRCPALGEHNREVLMEWLGYDASRLDALHAAGVLLQQPPA